MVNSLYRIFTNTLDIWFTIFGHWDCRQRRDSILGSDDMGLINNDYEALAFSDGLLGEKYIKCVCVMFLHVGLETTLIKQESSQLNIL